MTDKTVLSDKEIEKGRQAIFSTENPFCPCDSRTMQKAARWVEQAVLQSPEIWQIEQRLKDALDVLHEIRHEIQEESDGEAWQLSNVARDEYDRQKLLDTAMEAKL